FPNNVRSALKDILKGTALTFEKLSDKTYGIFLRKPIQPQKMIIARQETVTGTVTDAQTGNPMIGVNILVVGTSSGTATDADGHYSLQVENLQDTLRFSFIGYQTQTVPINGRTSIDVALETTTQALGEVVVTAQGIEQKKSTLGYAVSQISSKDINAVPSGDVVRRLKGKVAG